MSSADVLRARVLTAAGFAHGFSTRAGGVSDPPFDTLNLGRSVGDDPASVAENHRRLAATVGYGGDRLFDVSQVHGATVVAVRGGDVAAQVRTRQADALISFEPGSAVAVRTADCVPILIADPSSGRVASIHAGWRGVVAGVVREAVGALQSKDTAELVAAIGPSIGPCCFEVGDDVALALAQAAGDGIVIRRAPIERPHVDLWRAVEHQLRKSGVRTVECLAACTMCDPARFFSYRRDGERSGRMLSVIVASAPRAAT